MLYWSQNGSSYALKWRKNRTNIDLRLGEWHTGMLWVSGFGVEDQQNGKRQVPILMISFRGFYYFNKKKNVHYFPYDNCVHLLAKIVKTEL
jgi:hypothetical protein